VIRLVSSGQNRDLNRCLLHFSACIVIELWFSCPLYHGSSWSLRTGAPPPLLSPREKEQKGQKESRERSSLLSFCPFCSFSRNDWRISGCYMIDYVRKLAVLMFEGGLTNVCTGGAPATRSHEDCRNEDDQARNTDPPPCCPLLSVHLVPHDKRERER